MALRRSSVPEGERLKHLIVGLTGLVFLLVLTTGVALAGDGGGGSPIHNPPPPDSSGTTSFTVIPVTDHPMSISSSYPKPMTRKSIYRWEALWSRYLALYWTRLW